SLTAAVAASLVIGFLVSTYFAVQASRRARAESVERARAIEAEKSMEGALARGLANSLGPDGKEALSRLEGESLWELARLGNANFAIRFLEEATRDAISLNQLYVRSEPALIAALGLDEAKRDRASTVLLQRLHDPKRSFTEKGDTAFTALELAERPGI